MHVLLLHGYDSSPTAVAEFAESLRNALPGADVDVPTGPVSVGRDTFGWWPADATEADVSAAVSLAVDLLEPTGTLLVGFSQGGALALAVAAGSPQCVLGVVCGGGFLPPGVEVASGFPQALLIHGEDDEVVDAFYAESFVRSARRADVDVDLQLWPGGHTWPPDAVERITAWLAGSRS